jgi:SAM-dependent methyltransferase
MTVPYDPASYWEQRLGANFNLRGVGNSIYGTWYNTWLYRRKQRCLEEFFANRDLTGTTVLDIGSGTGFFVNWYCRRHAAVTGIDITQTSIRNLDQRFPGNFMVCDISADAVKFDHAFDIINMWDVVYHIVDGARFRQAMANVAAACRLGGYFLIDDRFASVREVPHEGHVHWRGLSIYQEIMPDLGFRLIELRPVYNWLNRSVIHTKIDNLISPLYYWLDSSKPRISPENLCLAVWQRVHNG